MCHSGSLIKEEQRDGSDIRNTHTYVVGGRVEELELIDAVAEGAFVNRGSVDTFLPSQHVSKSQRFKVCLAILILSLTVKSIAKYRKC